MKIGILRPPAGIGGAEATLVELSKYLENIGHEVWMHLDLGEDSIFSEFVDLDKFSDKYKFLTNKEFSKDLFDEDLLPGKIEGTDLLIIIHLRFFSEELCNLIENVPRKIVYVPGKNVAHVSCHIDRKETFGSKVDIDRYIFNSIETINFHKKVNYPDKSIFKKFYHLHPPILMGNYLLFNNIKYKEYRLDKFDIPKNEFSVGVVGRIIPSKEPFELLTIFKNMENAYGYDKFPRKLYFIGGGEKSFTDKVLYAAEDMGIRDKVVITGLLSNPFYNIKSMDVILHGCHNESLSRSLREAMLLKKPIVAYKNFGNLTLLGHKTVSDYLYSDLKYATNLLIRLGSSGKLRREASECFYANIVNMEIDRKDQYNDFIKGMKI